MRTIPPDLAAHLERGATTLCHCWKLLRRDGAAFGFTDHDRDLAFARHDFRGPHRSRGRGSDRRTRLRGRRRRGLGRARLGRHHRGRSRRRPLRRRLGRDLARQLGGPRRAAAARRRVDRRDPPRRRRFRRRAARRHAPPRRGARPALPRDLRGRSRRRELRHRPRRCGVHRNRRSDPDRRCARPRDGGSFGLCRGLVHGRQARLAHRRQCRARRSRSRRTGSPAAKPSSTCGSAPRARSPSATRSASPPAATSALPPAARNSPTSRTSAASRTCPATISSCASPLQGEPGLDGGSLFRMSPGRHHRRGAQLDRHALSPSGLAQGRRLRLPRASARCLARRDGRRARVAAALRRGLGREPGRGRARRGRAAPSPRAPSRAFEGGDVLLFRFREHLPAKHCAIATSRDAMIHAHDGATVCEVAIHPWWGRHLAGVFRFPPLPRTLKGGSGSP